MQTFKITRQHVFFWTLLLWLSPYINIAQEVTQRTDIPVTQADGEVLVNPWAGGMHSPQFSPIDLNKDDLQDIVIFDRLDNSFSSYLNISSEEDFSYRYSQKYYSLFDSCDCFGWALFRDFDCDGLEDLFCGTETAGVTVYRQSLHSEDSISFDIAFQPLTSIYSSGSGRLFSPKTDVPAIVDVDLDGDLDVITFSVLGNSVEWHRNLAVETLNRCDTMMLALETSCWGHFFEGNEDNSAFIEDTVNCELVNFNPSAINGRSSERHAGSTILLLDLNADSLFDALIGDISFNNVYALFNAGRKDYAYFNEVDTNFPANETPIDVTVFPACFHLDINGDSARDLIVAPNALSDRIEDQNGINLYLNEGSDDFPLFVFTQKGFLQEGHIELGLRAHPAFIDYNQDGLLDLLVGNFSSTIKLGTRVLTQPLLHLYENVGTADRPAFQLVSDNYLTFSADDPIGFSPASGDLDGDGDDDLLLGQESGELWYFRNEAAPGQVADFREVSRNYLQIDVGAFSAPFLFDIEQDGDLDLLIGNRKGKLTLYENTGSPTSPEFTFVSDHWGFITINDEFGSSLTNGWAKPVLFDLDEDGEPELLVGGIDGQVQIFEGVLNAATDTLQKIRNLYPQTNLRHAAPAVAWLEREEPPIFVVGNEKGGLFLFSGTDSLLTTSTKPTLSSSDGTIRFFPNPTDGPVKIEISEPSSASQGTLHIYNSLGEIIMNQSIRKPSMELDLSSLTPGIYIIQYQSELVSLSKKVVLY